MLYKHIFDTSINNYYILAGAAGSHIAGGHPRMQVIPAVTLSLLAAIALLLNDRQETLNYFLNKTV